MAWRSCYRDVLPFAAMVAVQCSGVGVNTLFKAAALRGMSYYAFIVYNNAISTLVLVPLSIIYSSTAVLPSTQFPLLKICLLALVGFVAQICRFKGIEYSSPLLSSAMSNLTPAFTFILAIIFRMESLALKSFSTQAKIIGTVLSISGALVVVLYKGSAILSIAAPTPSISIQKPQGSSESKWVIGGLLLATDSCLVSIWYIIQAQVMKIYPAELIVSFYINSSAAIISAPICLIAEANLSAWRLEPGVSVVAVIFSIVSVAGTFLLTLELYYSRMESKIKRASLCSNIQSLSIAITIVSLIFLGDALHLGSCHVHWVLCCDMGKAKEEETNESDEFSSFVSSFDDEIPLLPHHRQSVIRAQAGKLTSVDYSIKSLLVGSLDAFRYRAALGLMEAKCHGIELGSLMARKKIEGDEGLRKWDGKGCYEKKKQPAKVLGTIISIAGAFVVTLYKGPPIIIASSPSISLDQSLQSPHPNWILGGIFSQLSILVPLWYIVQGLFGSCLNNTVHTWALHLKGPVFVAMFKPLSIAIAVAMGAMFLGDTLHLGSLIGAMIISTGFYTVMWGKAKEELSEDYGVSTLESPPAQKVPLLQSYKDELV
ncbi:hypothetical protein GH714_010876 [Hevea brasiliensis]|uniref:EamA domain-containing protein n=1 Tax=Hevea brasiliensis TaxID=3981 RepID=A0A6A6M8I9_HEVBR|nr:hypothetical protein GH714_010876 [Hevea brasiliensis]